MWHKKIGPRHWVSMATDVHLGEGADVPNSDHLYGEVPEEVDDLQGLVPQQGDEDEGRHHRLSSSSKMNT